MFSLYINYNLVDSMNIDTDIMMMFYYIHTRIHITGIERMEKIEWRMYIMSIMVDNIGTMEGSWHTCRGSRGKIGS